MFAKAAQEQQKTECKKTVVHTQNKECEMVQVSTRSFIIRQCKDNKTTSRRFIVRQYYDNKTIRIDLDFINTLPLGEVRTILTHKLYYNLIILSPFHKCFQDEGMLTVIQDKIYNFATKRYDLFGEFLLPFLNILRNIVIDKYKYNNEFTLPLFTTNFTNWIAVQLYCQLEPTDSRANQIQEYLCCKSNLTSYYDFTKLMIDLLK